MNTAPHHKGRRVEGKYPGYWAIKRLRRQLRKSLGSLLARWTGPAQTEWMPIASASVKRVIICRRNHRLGNMLFLTPLLQSLAMRLPHAEIDILIGHARYAPLFEGLPGVRQVWCMPERGWTWPYRMLELLFKLRRQNYDLSIDTALNSVSNRLSSRLCGARMSLGFQASDQWLGVSHAVPAPEEVHEGLKPLQLVSAGFDGRSPLYTDVTLALSSAERDAGYRLLRALPNFNPNNAILGFFTEATGKKRLAQSWWEEWLAALRLASPDIQLLQVLPPGQGQPLDATLPALREADLRRLAAVLCHLDLFVACDSGPMHLAAAAGVRTLGLFHATSSARYRPLTRSSRVLELGELTASQVARETARQISLVTFTFPSRRRTDSPRSREKALGTTADNCSLVLSSPPRTRPVTLRP
jgi:ADP-heptose:LPS heptosyltransferase